MFEGPASGFSPPSREMRETSADVGTANAAAVLQVLLAEGPLARAEIADRVGLTRGTVTRVTGRLLAIGLLVEGEPLPSQFGRPLVPLALAASARLSATAHLGAEEARLGLVGIDGMHRGREACSIQRDRPRLDCPARREHPVTDSSQLRRGPGRCSGSASVSEGGSTPSPAALFATIPWVGRTCRSPRSCLTL